jgi:hypothetical protein
MSLVDASAYLGCQITYISSNIPNLFYQYLKLLSNQSLSFIENRKTHLEIFTKILIIVHSI